MSIQLTLPDGTKREYPDGVSGSEVAVSIGRGLAKAAVAIKFDGEQRDLDRPIEADGRIEIITQNTEAGRHVMRHSAAHVLAQAVLGLFPDAKYAIGPPIQDGFYYDFEVDEPFTPEDLIRIQVRMEEIVAADQVFERQVLPVEEAAEMFADQPFKLEIISTVDAAEMAEGPEVSIYRNQTFTDLCRGPHVPSTGRLKAIKLMRSAGAYWRGDENNLQLQRIYGTAWESRTEMESYLSRREEAAKRDHRKLGRELDLFSFPQELGSGLAIWHPNGGMLRKVIEDYSRRIHEQFGFVFVNSPHIAKAELWQTSGHLDLYADNMYPGMELDEKDQYRVKPMNCPFHILIYRAQSRSYRHLPLRLSELGGVYRYERAGVLHGLLRARGFTQDDSHTFCRRDQLVEELASHLEFVLTLLRDFGFEDFEADLSTRPDKYVGDVALWEDATEALRSALVRTGVPFVVADGEGAFYGPKIDVHIKDAIGRRWQMSTIQVDFNQPERFDLEYTTSDNDRSRPLMIHSAKFGSVERFIGVLVEHYAGAFPGWLAPVHATVVPVADRHNDYAEKVRATLQDVGLRVQVDVTDETVGEKVRRTITQKHPFILVVGDKDVEDCSVGVRLRGEDVERRGVSLEQLAIQLKEACAPPR